MSCGDDGVSGRGRGVICLFWSGEPSVCHYGLVDTRTASPLAIPCLVSVLGEAAQSSKHVTTPGVAPSFIIYIGMTCILTQHSIMLRFGHNNQVDRIRKTGTENDIHLPKKKLLQSTTSFPHRTRRRTSSSLPHLPCCRGIQDIGRGCSWG